MAQDHRRSKAEFPLERALSLYRQRLSYYTIAEDIGWSFAQTRRRILAALSNGDDSEATADTTAAETTAAPSPPPTAPKTPDLLYGEQVAARFGVTVRTLYRWAEDRGLPHRKIGGRLRFVPQEIEAWARGQTNGVSTSLQSVELVGEPASADLHRDVEQLKADVAALKAALATLQALLRDTAQPYAALRSAEPRSLTQGSAEPAHIWDDPDDLKAVPFNCSLPRGLRRRLDAEAKRTGLPASKLVQRLLIAVLCTEDGAR